MTVWLGSHWLGRVSTARPATTRHVLWLPALSRLTSGLLRLRTTSGRLVRIDGIVARR